MLVVAGVMAMLCSTTLVTVTAVVPETPLTVAVMVVLPVLTPLTRPVELTAAMEELALEKVAEAVRLAVLPSE